MLSTLITGVFVAVAAIISPSLPALACSSQEIGAVIDDAGDQLRHLATDARSTIDQKVRALARQRGWPESEIEARAAPMLTSPSDAPQNERAAELLMRLDRLGDETEADIPACKRLAEARTAAAELVAASTAQNKRVVARLDAALAVAAGPTESTPRSATRPPDQTASRSKPPAPAPNQPKPAQPWSTQTVDSTPPPAEPWVPRPALQGPPNTPPLDSTFSADEIADAGRGLFGTISSNLAGVIQYALDRYGRPNGYILGTEGGAAFLAGLRYGSGHLAMKDGRAIDVHWQGPSLGYDFGATGSRTLVLVYNLQNPSDVFQRFAGIDGSAYVVGGAGFTVLKRGPLLLVPIRTGLGLRIGASVGYLKFSPTATLNPF